MVHLFNPRPITHFNSSDRQEKNTVKTTNVKAKVTKGHKLKNKAKQSPKSKAKARGETQ